MPTTRPRHLVTESDELRAALDAAALTWPDLSRGQLVTRLALEGHRSRESAQAAERDVRRAAVRRAGAILAGTGARDELERRRAQDWPA